MHRVIPRHCSEETCRTLRLRSTRLSDCTIFYIIFLNSYKTFLDLKTSSVHNDKEQVDILERIIGYLRNTDKESMVSYMYVFTEALIYSYHSEASLFRAQCTLLDILDALSAMLWDLSYTVKNVVFEVIFRLLKRSELSDLYLLGRVEDGAWGVGFDPAKQTEPRREDIELASNLRRILLHILHDVLQRVRTTLHLDL